MLVDGEAEVAYEKSIITLLETERANTIPFNCDTFVFKSKVLNFFGENLTADGHKVDPNKVHAITEVKLPQNIQDLQSYLGVSQLAQHLQSKDSRADSATDSTQQEGHNSQMHLS